MKFGRQRSVVVGASLGSRWQRLSAGRGSRLRVSGPERHHVVHFQTDADVLAEAMVVVRWHQRQ